jgi:hypothetical protein
VVRRARVSRYANRLYARDSLDNRGLAVRHVPDGADVNGSLARHNLQNKGGVQLRVIRVMRDRVVAAVFSEA